MLTLPTVTNPTPRRLLSYAAGLALVAGLAACGGSPSSVSSSSGSAGSAPASSSGTSSGTQSKGRTLSVLVRGKQVSPAPSTVDVAVGQSLTLTVTSDHADELHIHGFDVEEELSAGKPVTVTITGKQPGTYEVETHHPELLLLKIAVR